MRISTHHALIIATPLALGGCANGSAQQTEPRTSTYQQKRSAELESERQQFIASRQEELRELDERIIELQIRVEGRSDLVDEEEAAEWSQELWELQQQRDRLHAELERAETASDAEWEVMRGWLGRSIDSFQATVGTVAAEVEAAVGPETPPIASEEDEDAPYEDTSTETPKQPVEPATHERRGGEPPSEDEREE